MPKKLLLADDSVTIQKVISITFASDDYELVIVGDGDSAVAKAKESAPDLVLADVAMPGKNGYEVCEAIKTDAALGNIPVMLLAGTFEPLDSDEATRVKADDSIVKPFESQELIDKVSSLLANSLPSIDTESVESSFDVPDDDFGADDIPGIEDSQEAGSDLDFLEGGIFEEATANSDATSHAPFVDLDVTDEEFTAVDSSADVLDISAATASEDDGTNPEVLSLTEINSSGEAFSFEPEAESLEVEEAQADSSEQSFDGAEQAQTDSESLAGNTEADNTFVSSGQSFEEFSGEVEEEVPAPLEEVPESSAGDVSTDSLSEEVVDYGVTPEFELESSVPEPGDVQDVEDIEAPVTDVGTEVTPELIEEPVFDEVEAPLEEAPESSVGDVSTGSSSEEVVDYGVTPEFELESSVPEPGDVQDVEDIEEPVMDVGTEVTPELIEEPVFDEAEEAPLEEAPLEEAPESSVEDISTDSSSEEVVDYGVTPEFELESSVPEPGDVQDVEDIEEPVADVGTEVTPELIEEPALDEAGEVSEELIESLDDDFNAELAIETEADLEPAQMYEAALEELEPEEITEAATEATPEPVESVTEAAVEAVVEQSVEEVAATVAGDVGSLPIEMVEEIVTKVAREIIEKVAWEVVPELAEELINAEIKKFKAVMMQTK